VSGDEDAQGGEDNEAEGDPPGVSEPARCATHPNVPAEAACAHCGTFSCADCLHTTGGRRICQVCISSGRVTVGRTPWEDRAELGWWPAYWQTVKKVTFTPASFFSSMAPTGNMGDAVGFALLAGIPGAIVTAALQFLVAAGYAWNDMATTGAQELSPDAVGQVGLSIGQGFLSLLGFVPGVAVGAMLWGCFHHLGLWLVGGGNRGIEATIKGALYAAGVRFWACIPCCGDLFSWIWTLAVQAIAYCHLHRDPSWKGAFTVLFSIFLRCSCGVAMIAMFLGLMLAVVFLVAQS